VPSLVADGCAPRVKFEDVNIAHHKTGKSMDLPKGEAHF
jgi:hypothetical protein